MAGVGSQSPNQREGLTAISSITGNNEYVFSTGHALNVNASITISGSPIPATGLTTALAVQIVDGSGDQITSFGGGTQYINGSAQATPTGTVALGYDGTNVRALSTASSASGTTGVSVLAAGSMMFDGTNYDRLSSNQADGMAGFNILITDSYIYNGSSYDRPRSATAVSGTTGTGLPAAGILGFDGTNYQRAATTTSGNLLVGTASATVNVNQQTVNTTAVQLSASSTVPTNGIIVRALAGNSAAIYVGGSGVTTSTGYELSPGESVSFTCNLNTLYIRSVASTTDKVCWNVE